MKFTKSAWLSLVLFSVFIPLGKLHAQPSLLNDVSYLYLNKLIATAKENYPRLKVYTSQIASAKSDLSGAKTSWLDPFSFQYVTRSNDQANTTPVNITTADILTGYQFGFSINPGTLLSKPSQIRKAKENVKIAEFNQAEYNLTLETEVKRRYFLYLQYKNSLLPTTNAYLDAESNYKSIKNKYQRSEVTFEDYNAASIAYNQAVQTKIEVETNFLTAKADLEELTVKKIEEIN
jgi:outer membrane protein TolC